MKRIVLILIGCFLFVLLTGCQIADNVNNAVGELRDQTPDCSDQNSIFIDTFDDGAVCGWAIFNSGGTAASVVESKLEVTVSSDGQIAWSNPGLNVADVALSASALPSEGPDNNAYGLICRYQDADNYYLFVVSSDGYYAIGKYQTGSPQIIYLTGDAPNHYIESPIINQGRQENTLRVECAGDQLTLTVNGVLLATVQDSTFVSGDIGLAASTFEAEPVTVLFDDVRVTQP